MLVFLKNTLLTVFIIYAVICLVLFFLQERLLFFPQRLDKSHRFTFNNDFEELYITTSDETILHGLLFKSEHSKGLIFYLHGNAGSLDSWGSVADTYTELDYDVFILDYRGYGKSGGSISGQEQFLKDIQKAYDELKTRYAEDRIIVLGYSIGTGAAAQLASINKPALLILQAPYYSLTDLMSRTYRIIPSFILKYKFETHKYLKKCTMPVVVFHGTEDEVIYYGSALKLQAEFKPGDQLIPLVGQMHNGMTENPQYRAAMKKILGDL